MKPQRREQLRQGLNDPSVLLLTAQQVAWRLQVCVRTLYRLVEKGLLPAPVRFSRKTVRWRAAEIEAWARSFNGGESG